MLLYLFLFLLSGCLELSADISMFTEQISCKNKKL